MPLFYSTPVSNIPIQPHPPSQAHSGGVNMSRTVSNSSTLSTSSTSSTISIPPSYHSRNRADSTSTSFCSYWSSPSSSCTSYGDCGYGNTRNNSNQTTYLPTPYRSSLQHSCSSSSSAATRDIPSSFFSDDELLCSDIESTHISSPCQVEMTTEEQVSAVRAQVEREKELMKSHAWWPEHNRTSATQKRNRVVRFATDSGKPSSTSPASGQKRAGHGSRSPAMDQVASRIS